jgi:hypothetical protein
VGAYINTDAKITGITNLSVSEFTNNADALSNGLVIGDVYRTGDLLKIVN